MTIKRIKVTDGVFSWTQVSHDSTKPDKGDARAMREVLTAMAPESRIQVLETFAAAADATNPLIAVRIESLRGYITQAKKMVDREGQYNLGSLALLTCAEQMQREIEALPFTRKGIAFPPGKPKGAKGPIAKAIAKYLTKHPQAKPQEVWDALREKPPAGYAFMDNKTGKYIEGPSNENTNWRSFQNAVSKQRPKKITG